MPRPVKHKKVCQLPPKHEFFPSGEWTEEIVVMSIEEYETIRLIDMEGFSQEECAAFMQVARTTVQHLYVRARKKLATVLVHGAGLRICGGEYRLCDGREETCGCGGCAKHRGEENK
jgi:predicted DNA-binding protein (UPF0251 family)